MDSVIVEDSSDGGHKAQIMSDVVVEERTDGGHKAQAREEVLNETMEDVVEERTDGEHDAQARKEVLDEKMKDVVVGEQTDGEHDAQVSKEVLDETMTDVVIEEGTDGEHEAEVWDEEVLNETAGNVIVDGSTDGEQMMQVREQESLNEALGTVIVKENTDIEQVRGQEASKETVGSVIVEESTDGEHKPQIREEDDAVTNVTVEESTSCEQKLHVGEHEVLNETVIIEENAHGKQKEQVGEQEALNETVDNVIAEESTDGECKVQVREDEALNETAGNAVVKESTGSEQVKRTGVHEASNEAVGNAIIEENTDGELEEAREHEVLNETVGNDIVKDTTGGKQKVEDAEGKALNETVGNVFVEEDTDNEPKVQAREEEAPNKTVDIATVEESTACEQKLQAEEQDALNEKIGKTTVEENNHGEQKVHMGDQQAFNEIVTDVEQAQVQEEMLNETIDNFTVEESTCGDHKVQVGEEAAVIETMDIDEENSDGQKKEQDGEEAAAIETMDIDEENSDGQKKEQVGEGEMVSTENKHKAEEKLIDTIDDVIFEESPDGEYAAQTRKEEEAVIQTKGDVTFVGTDGEHGGEVQQEESKTKKQKIRSNASGTRIIPLKENNQHISYLLPSLEKANFSSGDLVWGKVKSHPWWLGQIIDPSDATKLAMRYQKKDSFLIAYFGDKTFAWCDESQLKPFHPYFSQLVKQCSSDSFARATHDILLEVSRRVALGMACSCSPEEEYDGIKCQKIENAAIQGGNINPFIDRPTVGNCFQPDKLLEYIKTLAQFPNGTVDKLEFVMAQFQLKAFYHSKGYPELPVFTFSGGVMETVPEDSPFSGKEVTENVIELCSPISDLISAKGKSRSREESFNKQEHDLEDVLKQKNTSKLQEDVTSVHLANGSNSASDAKAAEKPISSSSGKKHTTLETDPVDLGRFKKRVIDSFDDIEFKSPAPAFSCSFKIGEFIRRAASQLTGVQPILKSQGLTLQKCDFQAEHKKDDMADFDMLPDSPVENQSADVSFTEDFNSTSEMLSLLCLAASDTMEEYDFVPAIVDFFTGFRNFCISSSEDKGQVVKRKRGRPKKVISHQATSDISSSEDEKHVEKHRRGMLYNVISQPALSDISSEEEKPVVKPVVEKRKRGRPRKNPLPDHSASYENRPRKTSQSTPSASHQENEPVQKRRRGRPRKVDSQLAFPTETHKRGRPRKVNAEMVPYELSGPDYMKDSCWSDMDLQQKKDKKTYIQYQKRRKSTGEQSLSHPSSSMSHFEQRLQLFAMSPKHTFVAERPIIAVEEKIVDECMPTALVLSFNNSHPLPSETDLIRTFSRYGRLKEAETEIEKKTNRTKVVFKRRVDAESAFSSAGNFFGSRLLSYQLKSWTPGSTLQVKSQGTQDETPDATVQDAQGASSITIPQENHDLAFIAMPEDDKHDLEQTITVQDNLDLAPISMVQDNHGVAAGSIAHEDKYDAGFTIGGNLELSGDFSTMVEDNHDASAITIQQDACDPGPGVGGNLEYSEHVIVTIQAEAEGTPSDRHDPAQIIMQRENQDIVPVSSMLDEHSLVQTSTQNNQDAAPISMVKDNHDVAAILTLQDNCSITLTEGGNFELSEQADDVVLSGTVQVEAEVEESLPEDTTWITTPLLNQDGKPVASVVGKDDSTPTTTQDNLDTMPISLLSSDEAPITTSQDSNDATSVAIPQDNQDAEPIASLPEHSQVTAPLGSLPQENSDAAAIAIAQDNHDAVSTATSPGHRDAAPIASSIAAAQDCDALPSSAMVKDNHDAAPIIAVQEQVEEMVASHNVQIEPEGKELLPQDKHHPALTATPQENQEVEHVALLQDVHDSTGTTSQDNLDAALTEEKAEAVVASHSMQVESEGKESLPPQAMHHPALTATPQENQEVEPVALLQDEHDSTDNTSQDNLDAALTEGGNLQLSEKAEIVVATDDVGVEVEGSESLLLDIHDPALITAPQNNEASELKKHGLMPITPENLDSTSNMSQDKHDAVPLTTPQDILDAAALSTPQDNQDLDPVASLSQDNHVELDHDVPVITRQDKCAKTTAVSNFEVSEQSKDAIGSDAEQVEAEGKQIKHDLALVISQQNQDAELAATLLDKHDSTSITNVQDNHDAAINEDGNLEVTDQVKSDMNSETMQVEGGNSMVLGNTVHASDQVETTKASDATNLC